MHWLGKDGVRVAQRRSGAARWDLRGNYGSLDNAIRYAPADTKTLEFIFCSTTYGTLCYSRTVVVNTTRQGQSYLSQSFKDWAARI